MTLGKYYFDKNILKNYSLFHDEERKDIAIIQEEVLGQYREAEIEISKHKQR